MMNMKEAAKRAPWAINGYAADKTEGSLLERANRYTEEGESGACPISGDFTAVDK